MDAAWTDLRDLASSVCTIREDGTSMAAAYKRKKGSRRDSCLPTQFPDAKPWTSLTSVTLLSMACPLRCPSDRYGAKEDDVDKDR